MPFDANNPPTGRPKGAENKETKRLREAIAALTEGGLDDFQACLAEIREDNPAKFLEMYLRLLEYTLPKLRSVDTNIGVNDDSVSGITIQVVKQANGDNNSSK